MTVSPAPGSGTAFITYDPTYNKVSCYTTNCADSGVYTVTVEGRVVTAGGTYVRSTTITITVVAVCSYSEDSFVLTPGTALPDQQYLVGATGSS